MLLDPTTLIRLIATSSGFEVIYSNFNFKLDYIKRAGPIQGHAWCPTCYYLFESDWYLQVHKQYKHTCGITRAQALMYNSMITAYFRNKRLDSQCLQLKQWEDLFTTPAIRQLQTYRDEDLSPWEQWPHALGKISLRFFLYKLLERWLRAEALDWLQEESHRSRNSDSRYSV